MANLYLNLEIPSSMDYSFSFLILYKEEPNGQAGHMEGS